MENKKVTLNNGTVLEEGKKYIEPKWSTQQYILIDCLSTCGEHFLERFKDGSIGIGHVSTCTYLPYTEPTPQKEWKTFMIETLSQKTDVPYRFFAQYYSVEDAREHHKRAISIMEVKLNIEPVNS